MMMMMRIAMMMMMMMMVMMTTITVYEVWGPHFPNLKEWGAESCELVGLVA